MRKNVENLIENLIEKDCEFRRMVAKEMIRGTIRRYKDDKNDDVTNYVEKLSKNMDDLSQSDVFRDAEGFEKFQAICLMKKDPNMYDVMLDMFSYNVLYIDKYNGGDDFIDNVLEFVIQVKDLDFLENECFKFIIDVLFPNKIYDRIRATLICMGKDINEVDEWYNWITSEEE